LFLLSLQFFAQAGDDGAPFQFSQHQIRFGDALGHRRFHLSDLLLHPGPALADKVQQFHSFA
jgi:hypothetical protein